MTDTRKIPQDESQPFSQQPISIKENKAKDATQVSSQGAWFKQAISQFCSSLFLNVSYQQVPIRAHIESRQKKRAVLDKLLSEFKGKNENEVQEIRVIFQSFSTKDLVTFASHPEEILGLYHLIQSEYSTSKECYFEFANNLRSLRIL